MQRQPAAAAAVSESGIGCQGGNAADEPHNALLSPCSFFARLPNSPAASRLPGWPQGRSWQANQGAAPARRPRRLPCWTSAARRQRSSGGSGAAGCRQPATQQGCCLLARAAWQVVAAGASALLSSRVRAQASVPWHCHAALTVAKRMLSAWLMPPLSAQVASRKSSGSHQAPPGPPLM